jgi:hypothetical protein
MSAPDDLATARREAAEADRPDRRGTRSTKIRERHLDRLAIVYVRQSSPQQVLEHKESRERQYALADTAVALGWAKDRVSIIDEDQGQSGRTAASRHGFQRLLAEVTMDHVGLVLGLEMSRLSRSSKDWHHLLEVCALFGTLLADQDGVYDPHDTNDRLLLGLNRSSRVLFDVSQPPTSGYPRFRLGNVATKNSEVLLTGAAYSPRIAAWQQEPGPFMWLLRSGSITERPT